MNKLRLNGGEYSRTQLKNNILKVYAISGRGRNWYREAHEFAEQLAIDISIEQSAGIIAALSPQKSWSENKKLARAFILHNKRSGHTGFFIAKCEQILKTSNPEQIENILNGQKITSFFWNILRPEQAGRVTIDRHALGIAICGHDRQSLDKLSMTTNQYKTIEQAYIWTAQSLDILPHELQAITWCKYRAMKAN